MRPIQSFFALGIVAVLALAGCNVGMAPEGPNQDELKKEIAAMPPEKQIRLVQGSPMSPSDKAKRIAEIEQKYGIKADATPAQSAPIPSAQANQPSGK